MMNGWYHLLTDFERKLSTVKIVKRSINFDFFYKYKTHCGTLLRRGPARLLLFQLAGTVLPNIMCWHLELNFRKNKVMIVTSLNSLAKSLINYMAHETS